MSFSRVIAKGGNANVGKGGLFVDGGASWGGRDYDRYFSPPAALPLAAAATLVIAGPALGYIRFFEVIYATSQGATPIIDFTLTVPDDVGSPYFFGRAINLGGATALSSFLPTAFGSRQVVLGFGETFELHNVGTAACAVWYSYYDLPAADIFLVRGRFNENPSGTEIIPAAPTGYYHKPILLAYTANSPCALIYNDDTAAIQVFCLRDADKIYQSQSIAAGSASTVGGISSLDTTITTKALRLATAVAPTARSPIAAVAYKRYLIGQNGVG